MNKNTSRQLTVRVRSELAEQADAYCAEVGLTFNALVAVALSDFLKLRRKRAVERPDAEPRARAVGTSERAPRQGRNEQCACGSGKKFKHCHGGR